MGSMHYYFNLLTVKALGVVVAIVIVVFPCLVVVEMQDLLECKVYMLTGRKKN